MFVRFNRSFEPTFHPERLLEPHNLKKPSKIFVCSVADLFAPWTPEPWRNLVLQSIGLCHRGHAFQLLTKNPELITKGLENALPFYRQTIGNVWIGTTITNVDGDWRNIDAIKGVDAKVRFASFEPLLGPLPNDVCLEGLQWVIVGKLTGSRKVKLNPEWVKGIIAEAKIHNIPIFLKNNLNWTHKMQEYPNVGMPEMRRKDI